MDAIILLHTWIFLIFTIEHIELPVTKLVAKNVNVGTAESKIYAVKLVFSNFREMLNFLYVKREMAVFLYVKCDPNPSLPLL